MRDIDPARSACTNDSWRQCVYYKWKKNTHLETVLRSAAQRAAAAAAFFLFL